MLTICAVIAVRNEAPYMGVLLPMLADQGIDVAIIDHESTDESRQICLRFMGSPVLFIETLPYEGVYSQSIQLEKKRQLYAKLPHDWVIHHDADEVMEDFRAGHTLRDAIQEADASGHNVLNFDEFVFLPEPAADYRGCDYFRMMRRYYFFEPQKNRLNRAWRRDLGVDNVQSGGHRLAGNRVSVFPDNHILRHYIMLSYEHGKGKYVGRRFSDEDLSRGWHGGRYGSRLKITEQNLAVPERSPYLFQLESGVSKAFRRDVPSQKHYWLWDQPADSA